MKNIILIVSLIILIFGCNEHPLKPHEMKTDSLDTEGGTTEAETSTTTTPKLDLGMQSGDSGSESTEGSGIIVDTDGNHYCGDGVVDSDEVCDEGIMWNGKEGHCAIDCQGWIWT